MAPRRAANRPPRPSPPASKARKDPPAAAAPPARIVARRWRAELKSLSSDEREWAGAVWRAACSSDAASPAGRHHHNAPQATARFIDMRITALESRQSAQPPCLCRARQRNTRCHQPTSW
ncbi:MAG: hypothetical protein AcusKO_31180 [Acuticoccus sp.]